MDKNKIWFGVKNLHLAKITKDDETGIEYGPIVPVPGAKRISFEPKEDSTSISAEN